MFRAFDPSPVENALAAFDAKAPAAAQLGVLWKSYNHVLARTWGAFTEEVRLAMEALQGRRSAEISEKTAVHDARCASAVAVFEKESKPISAERAAAVAKASSFRDESNAELARIWGRMGSGLDISPPPSFDPSTVTGCVPHSEIDYESGLALVRELPTFSAWHEEPIIRKHLWQIAGGALVIGWIWFGSFFGGVLLGLVAAGATLLIRSLIRSQARESFSRFVDATQREQVLRWNQMISEIASCDARTRVLEQRRDALKAEAARELKEAIASISSHFDSERVKAAAVWARSVAECRRLVSDLGKRLSSLVSGNGATVGALVAHSARNDKLERLKLRIGELAPAKLARLPDEVAQLVGGDTPEGIRDAFPSLWEVEVKGTLLWVDEKPARDRAGQFMSAVLARALALVPPGKMNFTLFDPLGLGHNFAGFLKLGDYAKELIGGQAWSAREHMRLRLRDIISHIETVTQKYLRNDYADIESYNREAGEIAEPYRILAIADFPEQFDQDMARDLERIVQNGPRCGVFTLIHANSSVKAAHGVSTASVTPFASVVQAGKDGGLTLAASSHGASAWPFRADPAPNDAVLTAIVTRHGEDSKEAMRVEVSYERLLERAKLSKEPWWQRSSMGGIEVPLGPLGAKRVQTFSLGRGLAHHALIVGRPGSGKSNLLHVFISAVCRFYSPDEVQLFLIDFKKGVEFKNYAEAGLPHARVIAVESEREFGLSVLTGLDSELHLRGERFRAARATSIGEFRGKTGERLPRIVLIVDEFQEFFTRDDKIHREAKVLLDRLVRQGRAFGIHVILGTQSLANAGVPQSTRDQMAIRIALQCSDADSRLILGDNNSAARLLSRPGEAIYNEQAGEIEGNNLFQVAIFSEEDRRRELDRCAEVASKTDWRGPPPAVFEGHEPAQLSASRLLAEARQRPVGSKLDLWLGEPIALKPPVAAVLKRQPGRNLLLLHKDEQQAIGVVMAALLSLATQASPKDMEFSILDFTAADAEWADHPEEFRAAVPHRVQIGGKRDVPAEIRRISDEVRRRVESEPAPGAAKLPTIILALVGLQRIRDLRATEARGMSMSLDAGDASEPLSERLKYLLREGPEAGVHVLVWCDAYASLERVLDRRGLEEFGLRIAGPLSGEESHRLFDCDAAAVIDKPYRMLKSDEEQVGVLEPFRPFALVTTEFINAFAERFRPGAAAEAAE